MPKNTPERIIDARTTPSGVVVAYANGGGGGGGSGYVPLARRIVAGAGLTGGGPLIADVSLDVGAGEGLVANADNLALSPSVAGAGLGYSAGVLSVVLGEGLEFEGDAIGLKANVAGAGLGYSAGVLSVGVAGLGLTAETDLVRLTSSSNPGATAAILATDGSGGVSLARLTIPTLGALYMDGTLDFGSDTLYEDASYLQVAGSKPVRFGQNIGGANWTVYSAGGANFTGNLDITAGGDLTVAGSGAYAGITTLFVDSSGGNVGINRAPDSQFALDVAGPARADYFVGQHAIQLKDVLMLCHFDGRAPFETNYSGDPNGHMGQVGTATGGVIFRPGKFYKSVQIAEATTNYVTNPSFETSVAGWTTTVTGTGGGFVRDTTRSFVGIASAKITASSGGSYGIRSSSVSVPNGDSVTVQCRILRDGATSVLVQIRDMTNGTTTRATAAPVQTGTWERVTASWTNTTGAAATVEMRVFNTQSDGASNIWLDACQIELKAYATPYCDGSLGGYSAAGVPDGSGHAWTGTAHASTSTRAAAMLSYLTAGNIDANKWTASAWVNPTALQSTVQEILHINGTSAGYIVLRLAGSGRLQVFAGTSPLMVLSSAAITANTWSHLAATYDGTTLRIYVNGSEAISAAASGFSGMPTTMYVGRSSSATGWFNGLIDDLCILSYAADPILIRSVYESNAPVFAESSVYVFRATAKGLVWGDDEGLWVRDAAGNPVLGVYGGEAATKSWGGLSLEPGDVLLGRGSNYALWDNSAATLTFAGNGAGLTTINGGNIQTNTITADKLNVSSLSAISANLGSVTAGQIVVGSSNKLWLNEANDGRLAIGGTTKTSAPFMVSAAGHLDATDATFGDLIIDNGNSYIVAPSSYGIMAKGYKFKSGTAIIGGATMWSGTGSSYLYLDNNITNETGFSPVAAKNVYTGIRTLGATGHWSEVNISAFHQSGSGCGIDMLNDPSLAAGQQRTVTLFGDRVLFNSGKIWHEGNHGAGSGLAADTLDGLHASYFAPLNNPVFPANLYLSSSSGGAAVGYASIWLTGGKRLVFAYHDGTDIKYHWINLTDTSGGWNHQLNGTPPA